MRTWTRLSLTLLLPLAIGCSDDKDPSQPTAETTNTPSSDPGTSEPGDSTTDVVTTGDGSDSQASQSGTTTDPSASSDPTSASNTTPSTDGTTTDPTASTDPTITSDPTTDPTSDPTTDPTTDPTGDPDEAATQLCVDTINMYRATIGVAPLMRWTDAEECSDTEAQLDGESNTPHGTFGMCGEGAQNECPGWPGPPEAMIEGCLAQMWAEGPGDDFQMHGHYINMSNPGYTRVACGYADVNGEIWAVQNFQ